MRIVVDTNVLVSALGWEGNEYILMKKVFAGEVELFSSPEILQEFQKVSRRPRFGFSEDDIEEFTVALLEISTLVMPEKKLKTIKKDPSDNMFLECALEAKADFLVSGDEHLLRLKNLDDIRIVRAKVALSELKR